MFGERPPGEPPNKPASPSVQLILADCVEAMRAMPAESVDAVVCDPPYFLGFMGKEFDRQDGAHVDPAVAQQRHLAWAREALRVLKPGGYLLAFGGSRTYHRLACAVEDAGFEIRDCVVWQYGSGFPKSVNLSIAIDKSAGVMGHRGKAITVAGYTPGAHLEVAKGAPVHEPITPEAKQWAGWGSALKPAFEPVVVGRKPFTGTLTANVLTHGTGGLNIDATRVVSATGETTTTHSRGEGYDGPAFHHMNPKPTREQPGQSLGRWPPNVLLSHSVECTHIGTRMVKATSGIRPDDVGTDYEKQHKSGSMAGAKGVKLCSTYADADGTETVAAYDCVTGGAYIVPFFADSFGDLSLSASLASLLDRLETVLAGWRGCSTTDTAPLLDADEHARIDRILAAGQVADPLRGAVHVLGCQGLPSFRVHCSFCTDLHGEHARRAAAFALLAPPQRHDALVGICRELREAGCTPADRRVYPPTSWDGLRPDAPVESTRANSRFDVDPPSLSRGPEQSTPGTLFEGPLPSALCGSTSDSSSPAPFAGRVSGCCTEGSCGADRALVRFLFEIASTFLPTEILQREERLVNLPQCPVAELDRQSGTLTSGTKSPHHARNVPRLGHGGAYGNDEGTQAPREWAGDKGGASRFFPQLDYGPDDDALSDAVPYMYQAKASRSEREGGCVGLSAKTAVEAVGRDPESAGAKNPRAGAGRGAGAVREGCALCGIAVGASGRQGIEKALCPVASDGVHVVETRGNGVSIRNNHPTVKPVAVMRWLVKLVTPPGGTVLDPFMGSGTTGIAAVREGFAFVGIEREPEYMQIAKARIEHAGTAVTDSVAPTLTPDNANLIVSASRHPLPRSSPVYVQKITSNVKGGVDAVLSPKTVIVGPNGAGKSAIVNAVELALSGFASDVVGRAEVSRGIDLLALAPEGDDSLWATATLSSGAEQRWGCTKNRKTGGAHEPERSAAPAPVCFPVRDVRGALEGSPEKARAFLLSRVGGAITLETVRSKIPADLLAHFDTLSKAPPPGTTTAIDTLLVAREAAAKQQRASAKEAATAEKLAGERAAGLGAECTEEQIAALQEAGREAHAAWTLAQAPATLRGPAGPSTGELRVAHDRATAALSVVVSLEARRVAGVSPVSAETARAYADLSRWLRLHVEGNAEACIVCGGGLHEGKLAHMAHRIDAMRSQVEHAEIEEAYARALYTATQAVEAFAALRARVVEAVAEQAPADTSALRASMDVAERAYRQAVESRAGWSFVRDMRQKARDLEVQGRAYRDLARACADAVTELLETARVSFVAKVQKYLPATDTFDLALHELQKDVDGKDVCRFGYRRNGALHTALSGAEWARLTLALAAAVTPGDEVQIAILTPEERAFDADTLRAVLIGLTKAPGQVLVTSPIRPSGKLPAGWTLVDLSVKGAA